MSFIRLLYKSQIVKANFGCVNYPFSNSTITLLDLEKVHNKTHQTFFICMTSFTAAFEVKLYTGICLKNLFTQKYRRMNVVIVKEV